MEDLKEVLFGEYCKKCKHEKCSDIKDPCDECLSVPARIDSQKPEKFMPKEDK